MRTRFNAIRRRNREFYRSIGHFDQNPKRIEIDLIFKPLNIQEGILYYSYNKDGESSDFISIAIIKNHIEFRYDLGDRPVSLKSHRRLRIGECHHVVAKRYHRDGLLEVDGGDWITGSTKGLLKTLNLVEISWVGGTIRPNEYNSTPEPRPDLTDASRN